MPPLEADHRQHAQVEDRVKSLKATGGGHLPFHSFEANAAWFELALLAHDITVWTQQLTLDGEHAIAEPKRLRYRILHVAGQITRHAPANDTAPPSRLALGRRDPAHIQTPRHARRGLSRHADPQPTAPPQPARIAARNPTPAATRPRTGAPQPPHTTPIAATATQSHCSAAPTLIPTRLRDESRLGVGQIGCLLVQARVDRVGKVPGVPGGAPGWRRRPELVQIWA